VTLVFLAQRSGFDQAIFSTKRENRSLIEPAAFGSRPLPVCDNSVHCWMIPEQRRFRRGSRRVPRGYPNPLLLLPCCPFRWTKPLSGMGFAIGGGHWRVTSPKADVKSARGMLLESSHIPQGVPTMTLEYQVQRAGLGGDTWTTVCRGPEAKARQIFQRQVELYSVGRFRLLDPNGLVLVECKATPLFSDN